MSGGSSPAPTWVGRPVSWLDGLLRLLAAALMFLMMALTFVDVVGRYVFNSPLPGAFEMTEVAMGILIFAGLPLISAEDGHINVNMLDGLLGARFVRVRAVVVDVLLGASVGVLAWMLWDKAEQLSRFGDKTAYLGIPIAPVVFVMAALSGATTLVMVAKTVRSCGALTRTSRSGE